MGKWDNLGDVVRGLLPRQARGVPLDVADDVARAAVPDLSGIDVPPTDTMHARNFWTGGSPGARRSWMGDDDHASAAAALRWDDLTSADRERAMRGLGYGPRFDNIDVGPLDDAPDFELGSPLWHQLDKGARAYDNLRRNRTPNLRNQDPQLSRIAGDAIRTREADAIRVRNADAERARNLREGLTELGLAGATVGIPAMLMPEGTDSTPAKGDLADTSGTEALASESRPVPEVRAEATEDAAPDYSGQARILIAKLNAMRRAAGGEVPEAKSIMAEVNRLLDMSNSQRNAPAYKPPMPTDYHGEAQRLLQDLNARRMEAGGEVSDTAKVMAEVRRLQALGDQMRNAR